VARAAAALVCLVLSFAAVGAAASTPVQATLHKLPQPGQVEVTFTNAGDKPVVAFRQQLPDPFLVSAVEMDGAACVAKPRGEFACSGFSAAPGSTWKAVFDTPSVYSNETGTDVTYFPGAGPSTFFVTDASGSEAGPYEAAWSEDESIPPQVALGVVRFQAVPSRPVAGKLFSARLRLSTNDLAALAATGKVMCSARVAGRRVPLQRRALSSLGVAECRWRVPRGTVGKRLTGRIEVVYAEVHAGRSFSLGVR
jgi:hypothetical protein